MRKLLICLLAMLCLACFGLAENPRMIDGVTFSADGTTLIEYPSDKADTHYTVPGGVTEIADGAFFQNEHIAHVTLPDSVKVIGTAAFQYCTGLTQIDMPERLSELGQGAFVGTALTTLRIPMGVKDLPAELLMNMPCLTDVYLPGTLTTIAGKGLDEAWDFGEVSDDPCVVLHAEEYYDAAAFARASGHAYIIESRYQPTDTLSVAAECLLPDDYVGLTLCTDAHGRPLFTYSSDFAFALMTVGKHTYLHCFDRLWGELGWTWCTGAPLFGVEELIPESIGLVDEKLSLLLRWGEKAVLIEAEFDYNGWGDWYVTKQTTLVPAEGGWSTEDSMVYLTTYLDTPVLLHLFSLVEEEQEPVVIQGNTLLCYPESRTDAHYTVPDGVEVIAENAFSGNTALVRVTLPESVRVIGDQAFAYCSNLRVVDMPQTLESLGEAAFDCSYVQQVTIPDGLTELPMHAFAAADLMGTVIIPEGVTDIGDECFIFNAGITDMYLPASLKTMGGETVDEGWGFDYIYGFNHIEPGQEHMTVHAPAGTEAAKFAIRSGYPYVIEDARGGTDLPAMSALVQSVLDEQLPGAVVCENQYGFPCVSYSAETVFAFATREGSGWYDEWFLCCFGRDGNTLTLLWTNEELYGNERQIWPETPIPVSMKLIGDCFHLELQISDETIITLTFAGEDWHLTHTTTDVWYNTGDGFAYWNTRLALSIANGESLRTFRTVTWDIDE